MNGRIAIVGGGDLGRTLARQMRWAGIEPTGFFDDTTSATLLHGYPHLGHIADAPSQFKHGKFDGLVMAIGYRDLPVRQSIFETLVAEGLPFPPWVHPSSQIGEECTLGDGVVVMPGCVLDVGVAVGTNSLLNVGCVVAHDSTIGPHSFLAPNVSCAGFVNMGERCFLGIGTTIIDRVVIGDDCQTGGGTVVTQDIPPGSLMVGVPGRIIKECSWITPTH